MASTPVAGTKTTPVGTPRTSQDTGTPRSSQDTLKLVSADLCSTQRKLLQEQKAHAKASREVPFVLCAALGWAAP